MPNQNQDNNQLFRTAAVAIGAAAAWKFHKRQLALSETYAQKLYNFAKSAEVRSPLRILSTLRVSEHLSSYLPQQVTYGKQVLFSKSGTLSPTGRLLERVLGTSLQNLQGDLRFARVEKGSAYLRLVEDGGLNLGPVDVRFAEHGVLAGASTRFGAKLSPLKPKPVNRQDPALSQIRQWFKHRQAAQKPMAPGRAFTGGAAQIPSGADIGETSFFPLYARQPGKKAQSFFNAAHFQAFTLAERTQGMLANAGIGLASGSYNKLAHVPLLGEGGLFNQLLTKRYLPIYAAAAGLGYADYLTGHAVTTTLFALPAQAQVLRAEATDRIPFARDITDFYSRTVPGPQYGPLALPAAGAFAGGLLHYFGSVLPNKIPQTFHAGWVDKVPGFVGTALNKFVNQTGDARTGMARSKWVTGALLGTALALPLLPGMVGSRESADTLRRQMSGDELVPIVSGRWWELGATPFGEGGKIAYYRPHWYALRKSHAYEASLWGSEDEYWANHPLLHPLKYLSDPYALERKHYYDRPYPITSPAFSDVPLVGPLLAATVGKVVKPPVLMHEGEWSGSDYNVGSALLKPRGSGALGGTTPIEEYNLGSALQKETDIFLEFSGLPGFLIKTARDSATGSSQDEDVYLQGSRQMDNLQKRFYERNLGAGAFWNESLSTEPIRRFIQREHRTLQVNDVENTMPSWLPGPDDYAFSLRHGDPYSKVQEGWARLPGPGYEALHPELKGVNPEDYPDITKLSILADVARGSKQYYQFKTIVEQQADRDTEIRIEYDKIMERVTRIQESQISSTKRKFSGDTETATATVEAVTPKGVRLKEYPGRTFQFSGTGMSAADMSALALGSQNLTTRSQVAQAVDQRFTELQSFLSERMGPGTSVHITVPTGSLEHATEIPTVFTQSGTQVNRELIDRKLAADKIRDAGPEAEALFGTTGKAIGSYAEALAFTGDQSFLNPMRYIPSPAHTKFWQTREPIEQYLNREVYGSASRRWENPLSDMILPWTRGAVYRTTGQTPVPAAVQARRDLDTMVDMMEYLQGIAQGHTNQTRRTSVGADLSGSADYVATTLPSRERPYFDQFVRETNPETRQRILRNTGPELQRALQAQWAKQDAVIAAAEGRPGPAFDAGRPVTEQDMAEYRRSGSQLSVGDFQRSKEIAEFFARSGYSLPDPDSDAYNENIDYEDVKLKILQDEGYDMHDFGIFPDRAAVLWRKPYTDGAVRELTSGNSRSAESLRQTVENMILASRSDKNPNIVVTSSTSRNTGTSMRLTYREDRSRSRLRDIRHHRDEYES